MDVGLLTMGNLYFLRHFSKVAFERYDFEDATVYSLFAERPAELY
jgi:hypothetical protein